MSKAKLILALAMLVPAAAMADSFSFSVRVGNEPRTECIDDDDDGMPIAIREVTRWQVLPCGERVLERATVYFDWRLDVWTYGPWTLLISDNHCRHCHYCRHWWHTGFPHETSFICIPSARVVFRTGCYVHPAPYRPIESDYTVVRRYRPEYPHRAPVQVIRREVVQQPVTVVRDHDRDYGLQRAVATRDYDGDRTVNNTVIVRENEQNRISVQNHDNHGGNSHESWKNNSGNGPQRGKPHGNHGGHQGWDR
jgi:hypothetical protein